MYDESKLWNGKALIKTLKNKNQHTKRLMLKGRIGIPVFILILSKVISVLVEG